ncbi:SAM-dependent methyltransferase [Actinopolymorpha pittospori]
MIDIREVCEHHDGIQSPITVEKIRAVGDSLRLRPGQEVLDLGAGTGGPAVILAKHFRCRVTAVENSSSFAEAGRERARAAGVSDLIEYVISDATEFSIQRGAYDAAVCFGAAWILGGFAGTAMALRAAVPLGGHVVIGDVFEPSEPRPDQQSPVLTLRSMLTTMVRLGLTPVGMTVASHDDWDRYHSQMMLAFEDWIDANPNHPDLAEVRSHRPRQLFGALAQRDAGWAVVAGRKRGHDEC